MKTPVFVLTGFLGSGKTSLLNGLLRQTDMADSAVVVNEFGEIGLDHLLTSSSQENIVLLDAGCLCCAVLGSLKETLLDLDQKRALGEVPAFRRVMVETTGLADPAPIMQSLMRDRLVSAIYRLAGLICVVDAMFGLDVLEEHAEARAQVALADRILISKTDLTGGRAPEKLVAALRQRNPHAQIMIVTLGNVAAEKLMAGDGTPGGAPWLDNFAASDVGHNYAHSPDHGPATHSSLHDDRIVSESFRIERPVTWAGMAAWIEAMRRTFGSDLLRCKGIMNVASLTAPVALHGVQTLFDTARMSAWPDDERRSRLVVIGRGVERERVATLLPWLYVPEGTQPPLIGDVLPSSDF